MSKKNVYFIHPSITYHTKTARRCITLIKYELGEDLNIKNASNLSRKQIGNWKSDIGKTDSAVGLAIEEKYTTSVWTVLEYAQEQKKDVYTIRVNEAIMKWHEGILGDVEKLSLEETKKFTNDLLYEEGKGMFRRMLLGGGGKY